MPNPLIYATTSPSHSLHKGDVAVGVNSVEYDPSNGWYNGAIPTDWDYVIYKTTSGANPNIFAPANEQEFYRFVLSQGGSTSDTTSIEAALAWIATQSDLLAFRSSLPNIVTDGLVTALDAQQISSYPTTGSTWYDLSGNGNDGTLTNGPTWDSNGWFQFDGVDDFVNCGNGSSLNILRTVTMELWFNVSGFGSPWTNIFGKMNADGDSSTRCYTAFINSSGYIHFTTADSSGQEVLNSTNFIHTGVWYHWVGTINRNTGVLNQYINGTLNSTGGVRTTDIITNSDSLRIGYAGSYYQRYNGLVSFGRIYSKALTPSEIKQNYYQAPIVTDGLVFAVDAGNLVSYESASTTTYSLTGSDTGTLTNGVGFNSANGGGWVLDGVNDYISLSSTQIPATTDWTYSCWFNADTLVAGGVLYGQYLQQSGNGRVLINLAEEDYSLCIRILSGAGYGSQVISSSIIPTVGENYNFAISRNGQTYNLYVNGKLEISTTTAFTASFLQTTPIIGGRTTSSSNPTPTQNFFDGTIYDLKFYDTALSDVEIQKNYQAQSSKFI